MSHLVRHRRRGVFYYVNCIPRVEMSHLVRRPRRQYLLFTAYISSAYVSLRYSPPSSAVAPWSCRDFLPARTRASLLKNWDGRQALFGRRQRQDEEYASLRCLIAFLARMGQRAALRDGEDYYATSSRPHTSLLKNSAGSSLCNSPSSCTP